MREAVRVSVTERGREGEGEEREKRERTERKERERVSFLPANEKKALAPERKRKRTVRRLRAALRKFVHVAYHDRRKPQRVAAERPLRRALLPVAEPLARLARVGLYRRRRLGDVPRGARVHPGEQEIVRRGEPARFVKRVGERRVGEQEESGRERERAREKQEKEERE